METRTQRLKKAPSPGQPAPPPKSASQPGLRCKTSPVSQAHYLTLRIPLHPADPFCNPRPEHGGDPALQARASPLTCPHFEQVLPVFSSPSPPEGGARPPLRINPYPINTTGTRGVGPGLVHIHDIGTQNACQTDPRTVASLTVHRAPKSLLSPRHTLPSRFSDLRAPISVLRAPAPLLPPRHTTLTTSRTPRSDPRASNSGLYPPS